MTCDTWTWALASGDDTDARPAADSVVIAARQAAILAMVAAGCTDAEIGRKTWRSEGAVKTQLTRLYRTLGARNRAHAVAIAIRKGIIS